ncbi:MAG: tetratricopeptide repeat protein, partial [Armatimonadetes bacterium]|nr:tetratricopeptide repeat protein [Armatimonadota bacterium]
MLSPEDEFLQRYQAGAAALDRGDWERARREFERLTLDLPEFAPAWDGLGRALDGLGDLTRAGRCFRRSSRLDRGSWQSRYHWGTALYRAGDLLQSRRWLRAATRLGPAERANHHRLGLCLADLGDLTGALRSFHRALECPENGIADARLWVCIGDGERDRGEYDQADAAFQRACLLAPSDPVVYHHWALLARRREAWDEAEQLARRARALERDGFRALVLLVELALERSDWSAAEVRIGELE